MKFTSQIEQHTIDELQSSLDSLSKSNRWVKLSNDTKADDLKRISDFFNLDKKIVECKND